jgi:hypothetical protein
MLRYRNRYVGYAATFYGLQLRMFSMGPRLRGDDGLRAQAVACAP